jgi:hypothetical protein
MQTTPVFIVRKFLPPRCPKCGHAFNSLEDFAEYAGTRGSSFAEARVRQAQQTPELFGPVQETSPGVFVTADKFSSDFIICRHCENVTFRIEYASRQVMSREEAIRLVTAAGFTFWQEGVAFGDAVRPYSTLSILGAADLQRLLSVTTQAKECAFGDADAFENLLDPSLAELVNKVRESRMTEAARDGLSELLGPLWTRLIPECRDFLVTAEVLKDSFISLTDTDASIDFSPPVAMYSKALEKDLLEKLFRPFQSFGRRQSFPVATKKDLARSVAALESFAAGGRELTLGDMAFCLLNLGCKARSADQNGFAEFLRTRLMDLEAFCDGQKFPARLIEYVSEYRNKSAHVAKLSKDACMGARAFLLEEPIQLLILLEKALIVPETERAT